ncbi:uncharacterized protein LOC110697534 [Chenopodium quinoa]|uniref:uncharacterized protein LOC110697534 n=1 Tax=Chenopodium quinoa TaxID=63459 RepID=UPI000B795D2F|nr:uncharacterized protein LOC110697534 [Chenopodium quinoa]
MLEGLNLLHEALEVAKKQLEELQKKCDKVPPTKNKPRREFTPMGMTYDTTFDRFWCMVKIDLRKAYDSVEWPFLHTVLEELGFPHSVVKWIMTCVCSISYSVMYLSRCLKEMTGNPNFNFHPRCEKLGITHMMFADDLLLFSRADFVSIQLLLQAFQKFSCASGLMANLSKSEVYFGGISDFDKDQLQTFLGMSRGSLPFRYLGVPLSSKKLTVAQYRPLVERVTARIGCWTSRHLSYTGRLQLIKSVLFGIQAYWAQIFILPKKILREIETKLRIFLWTRKNTYAKKAPVS